MITLNELSYDRVDGFNRRVIEDMHRKVPGSKAQHTLTKPDGLKSCLGGAFYQSAQGYLHLPIEKIAGILLYRIAEGQYFLDGNKRTAVLVCFFFLKNNGLTLVIDELKLNDLLWGFAKDMQTGVAQYSEDDAIQYVFDNVLPRS